MRTMRSGLREKLDEAGAEARSREGEEPQRAGWGDVLKSLAAVVVGRAARRVLDRPRPTPEAGRLGGEVSSASLHPTVPVRPRPARAEGHTMDSKKAGTEEETGTPSGVWPIAKTTFQEFSKDNGTLMAASVAFYIMLSLVPLVAVGIALLANVLDSAQAQNQVMNFLQSYMPGQKEMLKGAFTSLQEHRGKIGGVGLITLMLTATGGIATLETAINITWNAPNRNFIMNKLFALGMMLLIGALLVLSVGISAAVQFAASIPPLRWMEGKWIAMAIGHLLPILISGLMFTAIFKFFPNVKSEWKPALIAGFITAVLFEIFKFGYAFYTSKQGDQTATYGTLAGFVGLILWIYYSSALVLLGAELTWVLNGRPKRDDHEAQDPKKAREWKERDEKEQALAS